jgi:hypothetical protein
MPEQSSAEIEAILSHPVQEANAATEAAAQDMEALPAGDSARGRLVVAPQPK